MIDDIVIKISDNSQIGNIIVIVKERLESSVGGYTVKEHKRLAMIELMERDYDETIVNEWLEFITEE